MLVSYNFFNEFALQTWPLNHLAGNICNTSHRTVLIYQPGRPSRMNGLMKPTNLLYQKFSMHYLSAKSDSSSLLNSFYLK